LRIWLAGVMTLALAVASWFLIERPALSLKKHSLYQHAPTLR
jgi:peptidoglycan/LPS O-acetylase OafA/YrhL